MSEKSKRLRIAAAPIDMKDAPRDGTRIIGYGRMGFEAEKGFATVEYDDFSKEWHVAPNEATGYDPEACELECWWPLPVNPESSPFN